MSARRSRWAWFAAGVAIAGLAPCASAEEPPALLAVWGQGGAGVGELLQPTGVAVAPNGEVYVAEAGNRRIQVFGPDGGARRRFGDEQGKPTLRRPMDVDIGPDGRVYVAEMGGDRIQVFDAHGRWLHAIGDADGAGALDGAAGVWAAPGGDVYVADFYHHRVARFGPDGAYRGALGRGGRVLAGRLHYPTDVDGLGDAVVVADAYNHRVQAFSTDDASRWRIGGLWGLGVPGAWSGAFRVVSGVAVDASGQLYAADSENHRIQIFDAERAPIAEFGARGSAPGRFERPTDLDVGPDGRIYVADFGNDRVQVFAPLAGLER